MDDAAVRRARRRAFTTTVWAGVLCAMLLAALPRALALDPPAAVESAAGAATGVVEEAEDTADAAAQAAVDTVTPGPSPSPSPSPTPSPSPSPSPSPASQSETDGTSGSGPSEATEPVAPTAPEVSRREPQQPAAPRPSAGGPTLQAPLPDVPALAVDVEAVEPAAPRVLPEALYRQLVEASGPRLQPFDLPGPLPALSGDRSTVAVLDVLAQVGAPKQTVARILAPFPVAGRATYLEADGGRARIDTDPDTPVIAAADSRVGQLGAGSVRLVGADGTTYVYEGLERPNRLLGVGRTVSKGQLLGFAGGRVIFGIVNRDGVAVPAVPYLDRWLEQALKAAQAMAAANEGVWTPQAAPPEGAVAAPAAPVLPTPVQPDVSGLAPDLTAATQPTAGAPLVVGVMLLLLLYRAHRFRRPDPARNDGFLDLPPYGGGA